MFLQYPKASLKNGIIRIDHAQIREKCKRFLLIVHHGIRAPTTFKLEGEVTSLSESSQGEVGRLLGEVNCDQSKHCFVTPLTTMSKFSK